MSSNSSPGSPFHGVIAPIGSVDVDVLCVPVFGAEDRLEDLVGLDQAVGGDWGRAVDSGEFSHRLFMGVGARVVADGWKARRVHFVGAGPAVEADAERLRRVAAACSYAARDYAASSIGFVVRGGVSMAMMASSAADGLSTAEFSAGTYRKQAARPVPTPSRVEIVAAQGDANEIATAVRRGRITGEAANFARALANEPGNVLTPGEFAARLSSAGAEAGLTVDVLDEQRMRDLGMGLLLAAARGSAEAPRMVVLRHDPPGAPASPVLALIGKGVTFDSGGISIKPADGMDRMKSDMTGGASVAAALGALARMNAPFRVIGIVPTIENMPGGRAMRPGDVVAGASGTTIEINNTDAEGRLILADALWYAQQLGATHLVDVATLTGAIVVALGRNVSGLFGQPASWVDTVRRAASRAGDRVWELPIYEETREQLRSDIADMVNSAGRPGGAVTAAAFLREFAGDRPWVHLDIAGTAWAEAKTPYQAKGPTGVAVRTLIELGMTVGQTGR
ncbi:MAG: leucyl aminopeptidase [Acidobacteriota bacterium]